MKDTTIKILLFVIAAGLWVNALARPRVSRAAPVPQDEAALLAPKLSDIANELHGINDQLKELNDQSKTVTTNDLDSFRRSLTDIRDKIVGQ